MRQIELSPVGRTEIYPQRKFGHDSIVVDASICHSGKRYFIVEYTVFGSDIGVSYKPLVDGTVYALLYAPLYRKCARKERHINLPHSLKIAWRRSWSAVRIEVGLNDLLWPVAQI